MSQAEAAAAAAYLAAIEAYYDNLTETRVHRYLPIWIVSWVYFIVPIVWIIYIRKSKPVVARGIYQTVSEDLLYIYDLHY